MLTEQFSRFYQAHEVFKTHLLPPDKRFLGKIVFIFSNPDQAAESALYLGYDVPSLCHPTIFCMLKLLTAIG